MNEYLKEINDYLVNEFYEDQFLDMLTFANFVHSGFRVSFHSSPPAINAPILPKRYQVLSEESINVYQRAFDKIYLKAKKYCNELEFELVKTFRHSDIHFSNFGLNVRIRTSSLFQYCSNFSFNKRFANVTFYITEEPNWKTFKIFYLDYLKRVMDKSFLPQKDSQNLKRFENDYLNLIEIAFEELTPINKKIKINLESLKKIKAKNKIKIKALIKWKKFLSKIKAETNIQNVDYQFFFGGQVFQIDQYDYVIKTYRRGEVDEHFSILEIVNVKTSKSDFISLNEELAKMPSTEMHSLLLQEYYGIKLRHA